MAFRTVFVEVLCIFLWLSSGGVSGYNYKYLGCYVDSDSSGRDIVGKDFTFSTLTLELCINQCQPSGYAYAGLQFATRCLCGNSYGRIGYSLFCNCTCQGVYCGGYQSNDVFYTVDNAVASQRLLMYHGGAKAFDDARMVCVASSGDLAVVNSADVIAKVIAQVAAANDSSPPTNVWFGLHRRIDSYPYEWANENTASYSDKISDFSGLWINNDQNEACVSINVAEKKWESKPCTTALPFVCDQLAPVPTPTTEALGTDALDDLVVTDPSVSSNRLALYIVMPLFLFCYGGSCILYCAYKIYRNCCFKKHKEDMHFAPVPARPIEPVKMPIGPPPMGAKLMGPMGVMKRPLSGGMKKAAVYPMPMESVEYKGGAFPKYEPFGAGDVKKEMGLMRKPPPLDQQQMLPPPPSYYGNQLPAGVGLPPGNPAPGSQAPQQPPAGTGSVEDELNNLSIHEILKKKVMDRASSKQRMQ